MHHKLDTDTHVYFYEQEFYVLSNFSAFRLYWHGLDFDTSEHAYHWEKFCQVDQTIADVTRANIQEDILASRSAHDAFKIAEASKGFVQIGWPHMRVDVMRAILRAKASQHEYVRRKLLETGERVLVEDSFRDNFWGTGADWYGLNMLGKLWMEIRQELRGKEVCDDRHLCPYPAQRA